MFQTPLSLTSSTVTPQKPVRIRYIIRFPFYNRNMESQFCKDCKRLILSCICQTSAVKISQIMYRNISGTTKSSKAMKFACSDTVPCSDIVLSNVNLEKKDGTVETYCNSAQGIGYGIVHPSADCLTSNDKDAKLAEPTRNEIVHTEL